MEFKIKEGVCITANLALAGTSLTKYLRHNEQKHKRIQPMFCCNLLDNLTCL